MNIVYLSVLDTAGKRFNGADLSRHYNAQGHHCTQYVWDKKGDDPTAIHLGTPPVRWGLYYAPRAVEKLFSFQSMLTYTHLAFEHTEHFRASDIIHYQLINNNFFNITALPRLARKKPSVWTLHDMWAFTGHCVFSYECERWLTGCGSCPHLSTFVPMKHDRTAFMWKVKQRTYRNMDLDLIVASKWMLDKVKQSPLLQSHRVHYVPFGIDTEVFSPGDAAAVRKKFNIPQDHFVIGMRESKQHYKGLPQLKECLAALQLDRPATIITFDKVGLLDEFRGKFNIVECGWVDDQMQLREIFNAMDVFVTPSMAESFNLTAIEAMACRIPVIAFETTPMVDLFRKDQAGVAVAYGDGKMMAAAIEQLEKDPSRIRSLGRKGREIAVSEFSFDLHARRMLDVYSEVIERHKREREVR